MAQKTATLIGATGLIGSQILQQLLEDPDFSNIKVLVRRPLDLNHPKVKLILLDFADEVAYQAAIAGSDVVFCSVGTTLKQVNGDMVAYRKIDYDIPVNAARFCAATACPKFLLVSSIGADGQSRNFYLKLKGEVEEKVSSLGLPSVSIFRPSMLLGQRAEFRLGERIGQGLMLALAFMIPAQYKAIDVKTVAKAMIAVAKKETGGVQFYTYAEMVGMAA
ncbi:oxidoreductase [Haliscomenobacter hydrossis]|uniref:Semialdehyde dehydrogenase NAD-binding protein n=1 Tax=Haliscomenobacter hydrossis (strain ATCC 27775 / DSM 1100 / LMG 10767 / O) TaxID=760192 RepID=F4L2E7_HALH1|nr:oxidoreductase [Haliscomenobacter hydrossis]AEE52900.1 Semialdehyde dehydrogenase NAD - binding protein [Haliscomenobacter hydrossis DSM 1100]